MLHSNYSGLSQFLDSFNFIVGNDVVITDYIWLESGFLNLDWLQQEERMVAGCVSAFKTSFNFGIHQFFTSIIALKAISN